MQPFHRQWWRLHISEKRKTVNNQSIRTYLYSPLVSLDINKSAIQSNLQTDAFIGISTWLVQTSHLTAREGTKRMACWSVQVEGLSAYFVGLEYVKSRYSFSVTSSSTANVPNAPEKFPQGESITPTTKKYSVVSNCFKAIFKQLPNIL
jgi:hypothetical protein